MQIPAGLSELHVKSLIKGALTYVPIVRNLANTAAGTRPPARYYYSVWLRHLVATASCVENFRYRVVAELGPGDALGVGLCAVLSGADRYIAFDQIPFGLRADNQTLLAELAALFREKAAIPDDSEFPGVYPKLRNYSFPSHVVSDQVLRVSLDPARLEQVREALVNCYSGANGGIITFRAPWESIENVESASIDFLLSQAVLEHIDDLEACYRAMYRWLRPCGVMSHRIDYTSHGVTRNWYGHWTLSDYIWALVRGRRTYLINRQPHSSHLNLLKRYNFSVLKSDMTYSQPAPKSKVKISLQDSDLSITGSHIVATPARIPGEIHAY